MITEHKVFPLSLLKYRYINELQKQNQPNEKFWSNNLKKRLEKDAEIAPLTQFSKIEWNCCLSFWLIFRANLSVEKIVAASYLLDTKDHLLGKATHLRKSVLTAFRKSKEMA